MCGASGTRNECKKRFQESLKTIKIELGRVHKSSKMIPRGVWGVLGALGSMNAEMRADKDEKWNHSGAT